MTVICPGAVNTGLVQTADIRAKAESTDKYRKMFVKIALSPEKVADMIVKAIRSRKFLVITSFDIRMLYFIKRHFPPLYNLVMLSMTRLMDKALKK